MKEIEIQRDWLANETINTIYIGGGTPSLLDETDLVSILQKLKQVFHVDDGAEITLEANPDDITLEKLMGWKNNGINRLSIGVQSFFEEDLLWMNRAHNAGQAIESLEMALQFFDNISADLIYGTPGLTDEKWKHNVQTMVSLGVPHLSCYALTVEPKTPLDKMIRKKQVMDVDPGQQSEQFLLLMQWMNEQGYEHYEISNFARPGWRSRHNSSYWQGANYLGLGPSAHSFNGNTRQWNISNNSIYIRSVNEGKLPSEKEDLTAVQKLNEYIMTSLRTSEGIDLDRIPSENREKLESVSTLYINRGLISRIKNKLTLTNEGKLLADGIASAFFF